MSHHNQGHEAGTGITELERELAFLVRRLEAVQRTSTYPLVRAHYLVLLILERDGPQPAGRLASELGLDASTVARQISVMAEQGLITKQNHPEDGRSGILQATAEGLAQMADMRRVRLARVEQLFAGWDPDDRCHIAGLLGHLNESLAARLEATEPD